MVTNKELEAKISKQESEIQSLRAALNETRAELLQLKNYAEANQYEIATLKANAEPLKMVG